MAAVDSLMGLGGTSSDAEGSAQQQQEETHDEDEQENNSSNSNNQSSKSLIIPITSVSSSSSSFVEIFPDELLSTSATTLSKVMRDEAANLNVWIQAACMYMRQPKQHARDALTILQEARAESLAGGTLAAGGAAAVSGRGLEKKDENHLLSATGISQLAAFEQEFGSAGGNANKRTDGTGASGAGGTGAGGENLREEADQKFTQAGKLDPFFPMTWIGRGMLNFVWGRLDQAKFFFQTTLKQCGPVMPALLGIAAVLFGEGDFVGAQTKYAAAIQRYPTESGAPARVGFGLCCYRLGQVDRAKAAFARALDMDPECVEAMVGAALLDMAGLDATTSRDYASRTEKAIKMMSMANLLDHSNAMVQNHLANHYFFSWTPLNGTVTVTQGSNLVKGSQPIPLEPGEPVRIGSLFETTVKEDDEDEANQPESDDDGIQFRIEHPWKEASASGLKVWKKDYERVFALAKGAYSSTAVKEIQAESLFLLARVYHVRLDIENAHKFYERACKLAPDLTPARFGWSQTLVMKQQYDDATQQLTHLISTTPASTGTTNTTSTTSGPSMTSVTGSSLTAAATSASSAPDALALLGLLEVRSGRKHMEDGLGHLRKAIEQDPLNPDLIVLEAIALQQHKSNYPKALDRYQKAIDLMQRKGTPVPYDLFVNIGVLCHETKRMDESMQFYTKALNALDEDGARRVAALDQVGKEEGKIRHADNTLFWDYVKTELTVEAMPSSSAAPTAEGEEGNDGDGAAATASSSKSKKKLRVVGLTEGDLAGLVVHKGDDVRVGETFTSTVVNIETVDGAIVLEIQDDYDPMDTTEENDENKEKQDSSTNKGPAPQPLFVKRENKLLEIPKATTIVFNIARLHEAAGRTLAAIELHKAILKRNPAYVNSYLRLGCIAVDCGSLKECSDWLKLAATSAPGNSEVLTLIGNLHLSLCDWQPAQSVFGGLMANKIPSVQAYATLSMGTLYFETLYVTEQRYQKHLQYASDFYKSILNKDSLNAYAANGLGTVLAEKGEVFKAKEVFNRVREVSGDTIADALLNLGHIYLAQMKHAEAIQLYESYKKRAEDGTTPITSKSRVDDIVDVLLYISFAFFDWARHTELSNDANAAPADGRYKEAMKHLEAALAKNSKKEVVLKYNLCMIKLQAANCVLQKLTRNIPRTVEEVEEALAGLQESLTIVEGIVRDKEEGKKKVNIRTSMLEDFLKHCRGNIESAKSHLEDERRRAEEDREERKIRRLAAEAAQREEQLKHAMEQEKKTREQEERDRKAERKMMQLEQLQHGWSQAQAAKDAEKMKKARKLTQAEQDGFIVEDDPNDAQDHGLFGDSDEEDAAPKEPKEKEKKAKSDGKKEKSTTQSELFGSDDDDSDDEKKESKEQGKGDKTKTTTTTTSSELFGDDDSDNEFETVGDKPDSEPAAKGNDSNEKPTTGKELFGESEEDESDEELVSPGTKRGADNKADEDQPNKKRRVLEDEEE